MPIRTGLLVRGGCSKSLHERTLTVYSKCTRGLSTPFKEIWGVIAERATWNQHSRHSSEEQSIIRTYDKIRPWRDTGWKQAMDGIGGVTCRC